LSGLTFGTFKADGMQNYLSTDASM